MVLINTSKLDLDMVCEVSEALAGTSRNRPSRVRGHDGERDDKRAMAQCHVFFTMKCLTLAMENLRLRVSRVAQVERDRDNISKDTGFAAT